ncbi:MAG: hypothetical protein U0835_26685 [Isosphaeraceae bacterium]
MSQDRQRNRRASRHRFEPTLDGLRLETRELLTTSNPRAALREGQFLLTHPEPRYAYALKNPQFRQGSAAHPFGGGPKYNQGIVNVQVIRGGYGVQLAAPDGSRFRLTLQLADNQYDGGLTAQTGSQGVGVVPSNVVQPNGTIRAYPMPGGKVGLILDGTTENMQLVIDPLPVTQRRGYAHSFAYGQAGRSHILNIGSLNVTSGKLSGVLGFRSAALSGPLTIGGPGNVDRIAFDSLLPGAAIGVGGSLNTLDVATSVNLTTGPGISVARDLNLLNVGQDFNLSNGASLVVGRFVGATPQPPKGTSTGSNILSLNQAQIGTGTATLVPGVSAYIQGNINLGIGSVIRVTSGIANSSIVGNAVGATPTVFLTNGSLNADSVTQLQIPNLMLGTTLFTIINGQVVGENNFVARNGIRFAGISD